MLSDEGPGSRAERAGDDAPGPAGRGVPGADAAGSPDGAAPDSAAPAAKPLPPGPPSTRVDRWVWAVRLTKTRAAAATACRAGHVRVNGERAKPATSVKVGDEVRVRGEGPERIVEVAHVLERRVGADVAVRCYVDRTPAPPPPSQVAVAAQRDRGAGRPTKRERREIDRLRGRG